MLRLPALPVWEETPRSRPALVVQADPHSQDLLAETLTRAAALAALAAQRQAQPEAAETQIL